MRRIVVTLIGVVILLHGAQARADVITSFTSLLDDRGTGFGFPGQSITTPTCGPWDNLTFNWFEVLSKVVDISDRHDGGFLSDSSPWYRVPAADHR